jgi:hypothetical protein
MWLVIATLIGFVAHSVSAHGGALNYTVGDTWYPGSVLLHPLQAIILTSDRSYDPFGDHTTQDSAPWMVQRKWTTNNPIFETSNTSLSCNTPGTPVYGYWVHTVGPMIAWLAYCANESNDCHTFDSSSAEWFKIGQKGLLDGTIEEGTWFQKSFSMWDGSPSLWSEKIPKTLKPGRYLVRHEIISLHSANKPQFYPECAHLDVRGDGGDFPGEEYMVKIPGVWSMDRE